MKPASFDYRAPTSVAETLALLAAHGAEAKVLAGGQSLVPMLNMRVVRPTMLVSLRRVPGLDGLGGDDRALALGSMSRQRTLETSAEVARAAPLLVEAVRHVGHPTIRYWGTVGGSLAHADPAAELCAAAVALDARVTLASLSGPRVVAACDFFRGVLTTAARPDELLTAIEVPALGSAGARIGVAVEEVARRAGDFALAGAAAAIVLAADDRVTDVRLALFGVEPAPRRRAGAEAALRGERWRPALAGEVAALVARDLDALSDIHASAAFRAHLAGVVARRALDRAGRRAQGHAT
jgi:carbon-monoxide dehydrogenase medium subunit